MGLPDKRHISKAMRLPDRRHIPAVPFGVPVEMPMRPGLLSLPSALDSRFAPDFPPPLMASSSPLSANFAVAITLAAKVHRDLCFLQHRTHITENGEDFCPLGDSLVALVAMVVNIAKCRSFRASPDRKVSLAKDGKASF